MELEVKCLISKMLLLLFHMPDLRNSYLQCDNAECLPCVLHAMPDYFNLMNASLRTCIKSRNACIRITIG